MACILYSKAKIVEVDGRPRVIRKSHQYYVEDTTRDFHTTEGIITKEDLNKAPGTQVVSTQGVEFTTFDAGFGDQYSRLERLPQIIPRKDVGVIITHLGLNKDSVVLDAGAGSGGTCCYLAKVCKQVVSYEIREDHLEVARKNQKKLGIENLEIKEGDITKGISEAGFDAAILDMPNPWDALPTLDNAVKIGGLIAVYLPMLPQVVDVVKAAETHEHFIVDRTIRIMEEEWEVNERKVRPTSGSIIHSGFITILRKIA